MFNTTHDKAKILTCFNHGEAYEHKQQQGNSIWNESELESIRSR